MQTTFSKNRMESYVRANWFKLIIIALIAFVFLRKDLSFSFNINNPSQEEEGMVPLKEEVLHKKPEKKEPKISEVKEIAKGSSSSTSMFDMIDIPFIGQAKAKKVLVSEWSTIDENTKHAYIKRFANVAINERKKYGVPSSIILANGILQSFAGQREMSLKGNNHFALPCVSGWKGASGTYNDACYRHYENAWTSFRDHSLYVTTGANGKLLKHGSTNYKAWAKGLEQSGTFDIENLASRLITIIEQYELSKFDQ